MKGKNYYAPIPTFLVFIFYIVFGVVIFEIVVSSRQTLEIIVFCAIASCLLAERIIRFSYHLRIQDGKIYELGFLTKKKIITISLITKIRGQKENFWLGGYNASTGGGRGNWQREYYIESPENILPKYAVSKGLINDLMKMRPDLVIEKGGITFNSSFKSENN